MIERCYGKDRISYVVVSRRSERIDVFVFHENKDMRQLLGKVLYEPRRLLKRRDAFERSTIRAQNWLAQVMDDYRDYFEKNLVDFTFVF